jgi:hypothetical protein
MKTRNNYHRQFLALHAENPTKTAILYAGSDKFPNEVMSMLLANNDLFIHIEFKDDIISVEYLELPSRCLRYNLQKYLEFTKELMFDLDNYMIEWKFLTKFNLQEKTSFKLPNPRYMLIF